jgi:succinyl-diaminopimelate desuccinylase
MNEDLSMTLSIDNSLSEKIIITVDELKNALVRLTQNLIRIPSINPPGSYREISEFLSHQLRELGFTIELYEAPADYLQTKGLSSPRSNIVATYSTGEPGPTLIFNGHQDVVPPGSGWTVDPFAGIIKDGKLYGRGASDMKGTIAAMLMSMKALQIAEIPFRGTVKMVFCVDEETGGEVGAQYTVKQSDMHGDYCISEGPLDSITRAWNGAWWFQLITHGTSAHGSQPWKGVNAIEKMAIVTSELMDLQHRIQRRGESAVPGIRYGTLNFGSIHGGKEVNTVCSECALTVSRRIIPEETLQMAHDEIHTCLRTLRASDPALNVDLKTFFQTEPQILAEGHPLLVTAQTATNQVLGRTLEATGSTGFIDGRVFMQQGIPTIGLGIQDAGLHGIDEYAEIEHLVQASKIYALMVHALLR